MVSAELGHQGRVTVKTTSRHRGRVMGTIEDGYHGAPCKEV